MITNEDEELINQINSLENIAEDKLNESDHDSTIESELSDREINVSNLEINIDQNDLSTQQKQQHEEELSSKQAKNISNSSTQSLLKREQVETNDLVAQQQQHRSFADSSQLEPLQAIIYLVSTCSIVFTSLSLYGRTEHATFSIVSIAVSFLCSILLICAWLSASVKWIWSIQVISLSCWILYGVVASLAEQVISVFIFILTLIGSIYLFKAMQNDDFNFIRISLGFVFDLVRENPILYTIVALFHFFQALWQIYQSIIWTWQRNFFLAFFTVLVLLQSMQVFKFLVNYVVCGTIAHYLFDGILFNGHSENLSPSNNNVTEGSVSGLNSASVQYQFNTLNYRHYHHHLTTSALKLLRRALTTSFGSICFGSLLVTPIAIMWTLMQYIRRKFKIDSQTRLYHYIENLYFHFNKYGFVQVAVYGKPFREASNDIMNLFAEKRIDWLIENDRLSILLLLPCFGFGCLAAFIICIFAIFSQSLYSYIWLSFYTLQVGFSILSLTNEIIEGCLSAVFLCFAESPHLIEQQNSIFYHRLVRILEFGDFKNTITTKNGFSVVDNTINRQNGYESGYNSDESYAQFLKRIYM